MALGLVASSLFVPVRIQVLRGKEFVPVGDFLKLAMNCFCNWLCSSHQQAI